MKHTPTPWRHFCQPKDKIGGHEVVGTVGRPGRLYAPLICMMPHGPDSQVQAEADAKFIVQACNHHDALVEALEAILKDWSVKTVTRGQEVLDAIKHN